MLDTRDPLIAWNTSRSGKISRTPENTNSTCRRTDLSVGLLFAPFRFHHSQSFVTVRESLSEDGVQVEKFTPFIYVDETDPSDLTLYIQPLPSRYNVTEYKAWLINNDTKSIVSTIVSANKDRGHIRHNFSAPEGVYYVKVAALHPGCGEHGCANSTSPYIYISKCNLIQNYLFLFLLFLSSFLRKIKKKKNSMLLISYSHRTRVSPTADHDNQLNMDTTCTVVCAVPRV